MILQLWVPAGILTYAEDLNRGINADIGRKDFFEMAFMMGSYNVFFQTGS